MELERERAIVFCFVLFCFVLFCFVFEEEEAVFKLIELRGSLVVQKINEKCTDGSETKARIQETVSKQTLG